MGKKESDLLHKQLGRWSHVYMHFYGSFVQICQYSFYFLFINNSILFLVLNFFLFFLFPIRYLERAVIPDWPWPASRMEEDHRHGWYLLLAHSYRHHPVGASCHPSSCPWTDWVISSRGSQSFNATETLSELPQPLTHSWPWGDWETEFSQWVYMMRLIRL